MNTNKKDGDQTHDGYPKKTSSNLAVTDQSKITKGPLRAESKMNTAEAQAKSLINLVLCGEDPSNLMNTAIDVIKEDVLQELGGGPLHVGSTTNINTSGSYDTPDGKSIYLPQHEVVSIINPHLGDHGKDMLVLCSDGVTKAIIPFKMLGEQTGWFCEGSPLTGPDGFMMPAKTGYHLAKDGSAQGEKLPSDVASAQKSGSSSPVQISGKAQGQSEPDDDSSASKLGQSTPSVKPGIAVEAMDAADVFPKKKPAPKKSKDDSKEDVKKSKDDDSKEATGQFGGSRIGEGKKCKDDKDVDDYDDEEPEDDEDDEDEEMMKKKKKMESSEPNKKLDLAKRDFKSPQGSPGKNTSAPGLKEDYNVAFSSMIKRLDEESINNRR